MTFIEKFRSFNLTSGFENSTGVGNQTALKTAHGWTWSSLDFKAVTDDHSVLGIAARLAIVAMVLSLIVCATRRCPTCPRCPPWYTTSVKLTTGLLILAIFCTFFVLTDPYFTIKKT